MNLSGKSTIKGLAFTLVLAMLLTMVPMLPGIGQVEQVYAADVPECITSTEVGIEVNTMYKRVYASGSAITISQGAMNVEGGSSTTLTSIYVSNGGVWKAVTLAGIATDSTTQNAIAGYDLSGHYICGGAQNAEVTSTSITMTGGWVNGVYAGGWGTNATVSGSTEVNISGGTIVSEVCGGGNIDGGDNTQVNINGNTEVNISGGTFGGNVYGGSFSGAVSGSAIVNISGDANIEENVYGGGSSGAVSGSTEVNISGNAQITATYNGCVYGGGDRGTVEGNTTVTISDSAQITNNVYGGGGRGTVEGNTTVTISDSAQITNNVYGGGRFDDISGSATVTISGGVVKGDVNGSGLLGDVTGGKTIKITGGFFDLAKTISKYDSLSNGAVAITKYAITASPASVTSGKAVTSLKTTSPDSIYSCTPAMTTSSNGMFVAYLPTDAGEVQATIGVV